MSGLDEIHVGPKTTQQAIATLQSSDNPKHLPTAVHQLGAIVAEPARQNDVYDQVYDAVR